MSRFPKELQLQGLRLKQFRAVYQGQPNPPEHLKRNPNVVLDDQGNPLEQSEAQQPSPTPSQDSSSIPTQQPKRAPKFNKHGELNKRSNYMGSSKKGPTTARVGQSIDARISKAAQDRIERGRKVGKLTAATLVARTHVISSRHSIDALTLKSWTPKGLMITQEVRHAVELMAGAGISSVGIAEVMRLEVVDLERIFDVELSRGVHIVNANVSAALYRNAMTGNIAAQIFWLKAKAGWSETHTVIHDYRKNVRTLSNDELEAIANQQQGAPSARTRAGKSDSKEEEVSDAPTQPGPGGLQESGSERAVGETPGD